MEYPHYSIVVPIFNESESIQELHSEIVKVLGDARESFEIIFVDDGSTDGSDTIIDALVEKDSRVRTIHFLCNLGKSEAYVAGFEAARGQFIVTLDGDLQDDPREIPALMAQLNKGFDIVVGWKQGRLDNEPLKAIPSRFFNHLAKVLFGLKLHDSNCGFRIMKRQVAHKLDLYGDLYRFIPQLAFFKGFKVTEQAVIHRKRRFGRSKYGAKRFWTGMLDMLTVRFLTRYVHRPLHFFGTVGLVPAIIGLLLELYVLIAKITGQTFQQHVAAIIIGALLLIVGFQCIITGLIGEMLSAQRRQHVALRKKPND